MGPSTKEDVEALASSQCFRLSFSGMLALLSLEATKKRDSLCSLSASSARIIGPRAKRIYEQTRNQFTGLDNFKKEVFVIQGKIQQKSS